MLQFTYEEENARKLAFLDCLVTRLDEKFHTSVYVKETNNGDCINFKSLCPERYKIGVIKTLLYRGYHVSNDWQTFHLEIERIKQLLTNNNFPMKLIEERVAIFLDSVIKPKNSHTTENQSYNRESVILPKDKSIPKNLVNLYFENQITSNYKVEEKKLRNIVDHHLSPVEINSKINLYIYYKTKKISNLFLKNNMYKDEDPNKRHHVVYQYSCSRAGCNSSNYIGYTACTLHERFKMHTQTGSIIKHIREKHNILKIPRKEILMDTSVLATCMDRRRLIMTEAVLIKDKRPTLNSQTEGCEKLIKIFVH